MQDPSKRFLRLFKTSAELLMRDLLLAEFLLQLRVLLLQLRKLRLFCLDSEASFRDVFRRSFVRLAEGLKLILQRSNR